MWSTVLPLQALVYSEGGLAMKLAKGLHEHRLKDNDQELVFSKLWAKWNRDGRTTLAYLLDTRPTQTERPPDPTDRDAVVAATFAQWLGSPVGQCFLEEAGYARSVDLR